MKRTFLFLLAAVLLGAGLQSCNKDDNNGDNNGGDNGGGSGGGTTSVQWVDLGLPSGLLWADRNVGAERPEGYGNYYTWGDTVLRDAIAYLDYVYWVEMDEDENYGPWLTKYCTNPGDGLNGFTDNLTTLEVSDDVATVTLGDGARMATKDEWQELIDNTNSVWTTRNGVNGRLLTASNGKSLFLPAAGGKLGSGGGTDAGRMGIYWSSSLNMDFPGNAWGCRIKEDYQEIRSVQRFGGSSVRAVRDSQN